MGGLDKKTREYPLRVQGNIPLPQLGFQCITETLGAQRVNDF